MESPNNNTTAMSNHIIVASALDIFAMHVYNNVYLACNEFNYTNAVVSDIMMEYFRYYINNGGINDFNFVPQIDVSSNIVFMRAITHALSELNIKNADDNEIIMCFRTTLRETLLAILQQPGLNIFVLREYAPLDTELVKTPNAMATVLKTRRKNIDDANDEPRRNPHKKHKSSKVGGNNLDRIKKILQNNSKRYITMLSILNIQYDDTYIGAQTTNVKSEMGAWITCIGIIFPEPDNLHRLIHISASVAKLTNNNMFSILGGISIAYLTSLAATKVQPSLWIYMLLTLLESPSITKYCNISPITDQASYIQYADFLRYLQKYIDVRFEDAHISGEKGIRKKNKMIANPTARIKFYNMFIYDKDIDKMVDVPRSFGDDILNTMIVAYDTLLESGGVFEKVVYYGVLIPGQIVNISALLGTWYGMVYGVKGVPERWLVHGADG